MADATTPADPTALFAQFLTLPEPVKQMMEKAWPGVSLPMADPKEAAHWAEIVARLQGMLLEFQGEQAMKAVEKPSPFTDPAQWMDMAQNWYKQMPLANPDVQAKLWNEGVALWEGVMARYGMGPKAGEAPRPPALPRADKRFADARWQEQPFFALVHQTYLLLAEQITAMVEHIEGVEPAKKEQLRFATGLLLDALSPDHFPLTNPLVMERALETGGESLVKGLEHLLNDMRSGQLTHTDKGAFELGKNIAATPGKVVHESRLFQLIQYAPSTPQVLATPLVIFPPWINRYYILDLNPRKSFVKWAVDQGITVFIVSWKSADASMADVSWDDYVKAQIEAIEFARQRLSVPSVHAIGYCVAGTTLAATLAVLARHGEESRVKTATFFTTQVDFEKAGDLKNFIDDQQIAMLQGLSGQEGYLDGRYLAATFNLLRGNELIWNYVVNNYLLGQNYPVFDLLYWNGDTTNLPAKWHQSYLKDLYRDNRLVVPDSLSACETPIDLSRITTPCYIQAGREDHIAPPDSVWRFTRHLRAPFTFVLAGSGHIAGVVNPPAAKKYQYWTNDTPADSLDAFTQGATEHPGSWWPHWLAWLRKQDAAQGEGEAETQVEATGPRLPEPWLEDAPGSFVRAR